MSVPETCQWSGWSFDTGPALAMAGDVPLTVLSAAAKAYGGRCGDSSTLDSVSFVDLGPQGTP
jgi:hypothetical protein